MSCCTAQAVQLFAEWLRQSVKPTGLKSIYWWDGKVQKDDELLLVMKTQTALLQQLVEAVKKHHPYDEPEVISLPITGGSQSYLKWIHDSTGK